MAIQETGLGWYADSDWLSNQTGAIGEIQYGSQSGSLAPINTWIPVFYDPDGKYGLLSVEAPSQGMLVIFTPSGRDYIRCDYSLGYNKMRWAEAISPQDPPYTYGTNTLPVDLGEVNGVHLYRLASSQTFNRVPVYGDYVLSANTPAEADALALSIAGGRTVSFSKSTSGYSVMCMCEWITENDGDIYCSPVLISSVEDNTRYTRDSSATSPPTTQHIYQGMTFYMRKAPLDVLTGSEAVVTDFPVVYLTGTPQTNSSIFSAIVLASSLGVGYPPQDSDPYGPGGTSEPGISEGTFDETSDIIVDSNVPTYSFSGTGFSRIYNPSLTQLGLLANYLWTDTNFLQTIINHGKQLLENPMEAIISLSLLPCNIPHSTTAEEVKVMYVGTGVSMYPATTQFVDVDCGSLLIDKFYDSALDFNPYTTVSLFLPFIGMVDLDADEVMGRYLEVKYRVDIISGACVAKVFVSDEDGISYSCRYQFNGDCAVSMPLNSADFSGYRAAFIAAATAVTMGTMAAAGGAGGIIDAVMAGGVETSSAPGIIEASSTALTVVPRGGALQERVAPAFGESTKDSSSVVSLDKIADVVSGSVANQVSTVMGGKMHFQHASGFGGNAGMLGIRRPFVVIKRPRMCNPDEYGVYNGRPCQMYLSLATISGFTQVGNIHLTGIPATIPELNEIAGFLKSGVIL